MYNSKRYAYVVEKTPISRDSNLLIVKIGEEGTVVLQNPNSSIVLKNIDKETMQGLEEKTSKVDLPIENLKAIPLSKLSKGSKKEININLGYEGILGKLVRKQSGGK